MQEEIKKILEQQLQLLSERSKSANNEDLCKLIDKMINLVQILDPELKSRSFAEPLNPYIGHLSMSDLEALALARREQARSQKEELEKFAEEIQAQNDHLQP